MINEPHGRVGHRGEWGTGTNGPCGILGLSEGWATGRSGPYGGVGHVLFSSQVTVGNPQSISYESIPTLCTYCGKSGPFDELNLFLYVLDYLFLICV